ncbi:hypothetical protein [Niallia sp. NCCP-28]|uniref:hypothetical protein n=1 Tax=Niallia sp. NCCP-28 TaxID=2934712 RepID=UPI0020854D64|nr:hypothetical protein [Niallia sp. NCCP-28]GKU82783.1 hypothetical protein NCCP28_21790 [Niallia sp. NCCP-28]
MGIFLFAVLLTIMAHFLLEMAFDLQPFVHYLLLYVICFAVLLVNMLIKHYFTKNMSAIEKFLVKKQKNPYYRFLYGLANKDDKKVIHSYRKLVTQKKYQQHYPLLTVVFSFYFEQLDGLEGEIEKIKSQKLRTYYDLWLKIKRKKQVSNKEFSKVKTPWMKEALLGELKEATGQTEQAQIHRRNALKLAKGLIFYQLKKQYERKYID